MNNKASVLSMLRSELTVVNCNTTDIINASIVLSRNNIEHKVIQGWKINTEKPLNREAYLFIELSIDNRIYYLNITDDIHLSRENIKGVFKKRPSDKYIAYRITNSYY